MTEQDEKIKELLKGHFDAPNLSPDFTENIMKNIAAQEVMQKQSEFEYVPVISKFGWIVIGFLFLGFASLGLTGEKASKFNMTDFMPDMSFNFSLIHSQVALMALFGILILLFVDRLVEKFRLV